MLKRMINDRKGFTLVEMLVVITIIGILASLALPNYMKAKNKAKEAECKANLHVLQAALERYSTDNDGTYPPYLIGGDKGGWLYWHSRYDNNLRNAMYLRDPLIEYGYIDSYPTNPFVGDSAVRVIATGGNDMYAGSGDPRFGIGGSRCGNVVEDPRYYRQDFPADKRDPVIETYLTLPQTALGFSDIYHYEMGGHMNMENGEFIRGGWNGDFFYRATKEIKLGRTGAQDGIVKYPDYGWTAKNDYYILGAFGAPETRGLDVVRNIGIDPGTGNQLSYRTPPESGLNIPIGRAGIDGNGIPEVFGGGSAQLGPVWPYNYDIDKRGVEEMRFGAPDGIEDGVVLVLTSTGNNWQF